MTIPWGDVPHLASLHIHKFPERWRMPGLVWKVNLSSGSSVMKGWWFTERCIDLASFRFEFVINSHGWREIIKKRLINETVMGRISTVHHSCLRTQLFWWTSTLSFDTEEWKEGITAGNWTLTAPSATWPWVMSYFMNCAFMSPIYDILKVSASEIAANFSQSPHSLILRGITVGEPEFYQLWCLSKSVNEEIEKN